MKMRKAWGFTPTGMVVPTVLVSVLMTDTVSEYELPT
jgi:hypothetical protein